MSDFKTDLAELATKEEESSKAFTTSESRPETEKTESAPSPEEQKPEASHVPASTKEIPLHKQARWIRQQKELETLRSEVEAIRKSKEEPKPVPTTTNVPKQFEKLFGDDVDAYEAWRSFQRQEAESIYETRLQKERETAQREEQAAKSAVAYAEDQFLSLAEETGIAFNDKSNTERNQILNICDTYELFNAEGLPNIQAANSLRLKLFPDTNQEVTEEKKKVLAKTNAKSNAVPNDSKIFTPSKLKKMNMAQFFN